MANSPAHKLGEYIGWFLENMMIKKIEPIASNYGLYTDHEHSRKARNGNKKVRWNDDIGNHHDLDIVLEKHGTEEQFGIPIVFIEMAWRRYTKHSKNKAQEISDSVRAVIRNNATYAPFYAVVLAGTFTANSIKQLKSEGFSVLYFNYNIVKEAFSSITNINISTDEKTTENKIQEIYNLLNKLSDEQIEKVENKLIALNKNEYDKFISELTTSINRKTAKIFISTNFRTSNNFVKLTDAINFLEKINDQDEYNKASFYQFRVEILFDNNESVTGNFYNASKAISFLKLNI